MGGAKISDKLKVIEHLLPKVDLMLIGGGMCFTLLHAEGYSIGESLLEESMVGTVRGLLRSEDGDKIVLPKDVVVADRFAADALVETVSVSEIPNNRIGMDIGPETIAQFSEAIAGAEAVFWNGPMGVFEWEAFRPGTEGVAKAMAASEGYTVIGGGDSVAAIRMLNMQDDVAHISSGGGAGLEMLEGASLPGITVLEREKNDA
jgi:phosphoglycerate kinase